MTMKKKFYQKKWFIALVVIFVLSMIFGTSETETNVDSTQGTVQTEQHTEVMEENTATETEIIVEEVETEDVVIEDTTLEDTSSTEITESTNDIEIHIYDNARLKDVMNGNRTEKIGEYSIVEVPYSEVTDEALTDWYFNYVSKNDYNYYIILYLDTDDCKGVYAIPGLVQKDVIFTEDEYGDYSLNDTASVDESIMYVPTENNTLEELSFE